MSYGEFKGSIEFCSRAGNKYTYLKNTQMILANEGLAASSGKRLELIRQLENSYTQGRDMAFHNTAESAKVDVLKNGLKELVLEVTTGCNMRCRYCIFGNYYDQLKRKSPSPQNMSEDVAYRAIDMYYDLIMEGKKFNPERRPCVAFYGGEPLMNWDLVKKASLYARKKFGKDVFITLTSNATLLNDDILYFFKEHDIYPLFSLDGPKNQNDKNRVNSIGNGTFDLVTQKLNRAVEILERPMFINAVFTIKTDLNEVVDFFAENPQFYCISFSTVNDLHTTFYDQFTPEDIEQYNSCINALYEEFFNGIRGEDYGKTRNKRIPILNLLLCSQVLPIINRQMFSVPNPESLYTRTCYPGDRIFIETDGNIHLCEKISRSRPLGNVFTGYNFSSAADLINEYRSSICTKCDDCIIKNVCPTCYNSYLVDGAFSRSKDQCEESVNRFISTLSCYESINEGNATWLDQYRNDYYEKIREMLVTLL